MSAATATEPTDVEQPDATATTNGAPQGWDPYEVWRVRVLLPRLREIEARGDQTITRLPGSLDLESSSGSGSGRSRRLNE